MLGSWDEWVPPARMLKMTEGNLALQKSLREQQQAATRDSGSAGPSKAAAGGGSKAGAGGGGSAAAARRKEGTRGTKRARDDDDGARKPELRLMVPEVLKVLLVDDWEAVTKNTQLVTLPREPTVVEILQEFKAWVMQRHTTSYAPFLL